MTSIRVVYVLGSGRTGSTILGQIMNSVEGIFFAGEAIDFWLRAVVENRLCGCGERARGCPVWGPVISAVEDHLPESRLDRLIQARSQTWWARRVARGASIVSGRSADVYAGEASSSVELLYRAIQDQTGASMIVDTSKFAFYAQALNSIPSIDLSFVHLVRDPRAVAHSWKRRKRILDPEEDIWVPQFGSLSSTVRWISRNSTAISLARRAGRPYVLIRYEDLVASPRRIIDRISAELGFDATRAALANESAQDLPPNHAIWGNPTRFESGKIELTLDDAYKNLQPPIDSALVSVLALPWLARFGYRFLDY